MRQVCLDYNLSVALYPELIRQSDYDVGAGPCPHMSVRTVCALGPSGATAGTPLLHGVSAGCDAMGCRTTDLPERTLLSWLHRVPPLVEREKTESDRASV